MAPETEKAVDSQATQLRAVALGFVSGINTPCQPDRPVMMLTSSGPQATCVPSGLGGLRAAKGALNVPGCWMLARLVGRILAALAISDSQCDLLLSGVCSR